MNQVWKITNENILERLTMYDAMICRDDEFLDFVLYLSPDSIRAAVEKYPTVFNDIEKSGGCIVKTFVALNLMYPFDLERLEFSHMAILDSLGLFGSESVKLIDKHTTEAEKCELVIAAVNSILERAKVTPTRKLRWGENVLPQCEAIKSMFPLIFKRVDHALMLKNNERDVMHEMDTLSSRLERSIYASMSKDEQLSVVRQMNEAFQDIYQLITNNEFSDVQLILSKTEKAQLELIQFLQQKKQEQPVRLLYYWTGNDVLVKIGGPVDTSDPEIRQMARLKLLQKNRSKDSKEFPHILSLSCLEDFLQLNQVRNEDICVDPTSIQTFYCFDNVKSPTLTRDFIRLWYNYDCPILSRYTPNINRNYSLMGLMFPHFTNQLVESTYDDVYVDEDITVEEANAITRGHEHTSISDKISLVLDCRSISNVDELQERVDSFDQNLQAVINDGSEEIKLKLFEAFQPLLRNLNGTITIDDSNFGGYDCGYIHIYCDNQPYMKERELLSVLKSGIQSKSMNVSMPFFSQSITVMREQFEIVQEYVYSKTGIKLFERVFMD